ncbi:MAG: YwiC-like family protein [Nocardioides sp.]|nr:YwiC-like family protein [Nocardioides sp.]
MPPQHGAWAFVGLPLVLGALATPASWTTLLLTWAAFTCYPASYFALSMARARRGARFRRPLLVWTLAASVPAAALVVTRPWLVAVGLGYACLFAVNLAFARRNHERDLVNDAVLIVEVAALVPLTRWLAEPVDGVPERVWLLTALCALTLVGSTLHVKSLLRERRNPTYARASHAFAISSLVAVVGLAWVWGLPAGVALVLPFVLLTARALKRDWSGWRPGRIGLVELACFVAVAAGAAAAVRF